MYAEWNNKAAAIVSYGVDGGVRAAQALRPVFGALQLADVGADVTLNLRTDFRDFGTAFTPGEHQTAALDALLGQLVTWSTALAATRTPNADCPTAAAPLEPGPWRRAARPARRQPREEISHSTSAAARTEDSPGRRSAHHAAA